MNASHGLRLASLLALWALPAIAEKPNCVFKPTMTTDEVAACAAAEPDEEREARERAGRAKAEYEMRIAEIGAAQKAASDARAAKVTPTGPAIGMTPDEIVALPFPWGKPDKVNKTTNATGVHEQWVYTDVHGMGIQYLYFDNGVLTSIQE